MKNPKIIHQDDQVLVINKPPDLVVNRAESVKVKTLQDWIESTQTHALSKSVQYRNGIVHRLDKNTSGVMLIAKTANSLKKLQRQFHDREVDKTYTALVHGKLQPKEGHISLPLARSSTNRESFTVSLAGKMSKTAYLVKNYFERLSEKKLNSKSYQGFSLVNLFPKTGRTHQIRVILKHLGHPIVGDEKYVGKKRIKADRQWIARQFLHASEISFTHPTKGSKETFKAPLTKDLRLSLKLLKA